MLNEMIEKAIEKILLGENKPQALDTITTKICMVRTYSAGVHFGEVVWRNGRECLLKNARRVFSWQKACSLSQLAIEGSKDISNCKIAGPVPEILLTEAIEFIPMSSAAIQNLCQKEGEWKS